jgi:hypothetical protein
VRSVLAWLILAVAVAAAAVPEAAEAAAVRGGPLPAPLVAADNWWRTDVSAAPVDPGSASFISFIGATKGLRPDFGGSPAACEIYGFPYATVGASQPKRAVQFDYADESDGVDPATGQGIPFYPVPDEAITQCNWIEGGAPGNQNLGGDRHLLLYDTDNQLLYELYSLFWDGVRWTAGSGALFDLRTNNRRPEGWTSADAAGLAILPGLVRYDETFGTAEITHAFRVTVRATNGTVYPASHAAGSTAGALPMGARLRLKASRDISGFAPEVQRIFRAMKTHGLIVADNGTDLYVSGVHDTRWNNDVLNPAFALLKASDFEVIQLGWSPPAATPRIESFTASPASLVRGGCSTLSWSTLGATSVTLDGGAVGAREATGTCPSATTTHTLVAAGTGGPATRRLTVRVVSTAAEMTVPFGSFDTPASGTTGVTGAIPVTGWALDDVRVRKVEIYRSPLAGEPTSPNGKVYIGDTTFVPGARPDVEGAFANFPFAARAGWGYMLLTNFLPAGGNGTTTLHAYASDDDGHSTLLGSKAITCSNATATKPFGTIDTPGQGETVSGTVVDFGWALTPQPAAIPTDGSTITVYVDGAPAGHPTYNQYRSDIATLFPGYANTGGAVGYFVLDTTALTNGVHTIAWSVTDNQGRADGIGSRYFWVGN